MCTLTNTTYGEVSWTPCCNACGSDNASPISRLCRLCYDKVYYQKNKVTILQKAKIKAQEPAAKARRAELNKAWNSNPANQERRKAAMLRHSRTPGGRFTRSKLRATAKQTTWSLTKQTYFALIKMECWYCNGFFQKQADMTGIGLDRIDNAKGYEPGNVVSCCGACNLTRQNRWTCEQAKVMIEAVIQYNKLHNIPAPNGTIED